MKLTGGRGADITVEVGGAGTLPRSFMATRTAGGIARHRPADGPEATGRRTPLICGRDLRVQGL